MTEDCRKSMKLLVLMVWFLITFLYIAVSFKVIEHSILNNRRTNSKYIYNHIYTYTYTYKYICLYMFNKYIYRYYVCINVYTYNICYIYNKYIER